MRSEVVVEEIEDRKSNGRKRVLSYAEAHGGGDSSSRIGCGAGDE